MKLVAVARAPTRRDEAARAVADATGLTLAEARMRLAPEPPAVLARLDPEASSVLVATLRKAGLAAVAVEACSPSDKDRTVAHTFSVEEAHVTFTPRFGDATRVRWSDVLAILRGLRASRSEVERTEKVKTISVANAFLTGGLVMSRTARKTTRASQEDDEQVILVYARDGRAVTLAEHELDWSCLGSRMQPSAAANMVVCARMLRERAPGAFYDERLLRLGRRPLPFLTRGESHARTPSSATTRIDTSGSLDTLAEVMRQALVESLLP